MNGKLANVTGMSGSVIRGQRIERIPSNSDVPLALLIAYLRRIGMAISVGLIRVSVDMGHIVSYCVGLSGYSAYTLGYPMGS